MSEQKMRGLPYPQVQATPEEMFGEPVERLFGRTRVALLSREQIDRLPERAREVVEYRKSGLSLNHIQGCPLDCLIPTGRSN